MCRVHLFPVWVALAGLSGIGGVALADEPASDQRAAELVRQLGDAEFAARSRAAGELQEMGVASLAALRQAHDHPDPEVRHRVRRLLADIEQLDHEQRLTEFCDDPEHAENDLLPGLEEYRKAVGGNAAACELLVRMQRAEPKLFRLLSGDGRLLEAEYERRGLEIQYVLTYAGDRKEVFDNVCALLFIGGDSRINVSEQTANQIASFLHHHEFRTALLSGQHSEALRKLLGRWIAGSAILNPYLKVNLALQYDIPEGIHPALEMLDGPGVNSQAQYAVLALARFGDRRHVPVLERLLDDQTVLTISRANEQVVYTCEIRDVALAALLHLTGQEVREYGFSRLTTNPQYLFSPSSTGFSSDADRSEALARWRAWRKEHRFDAPVNTASARRER